MTFLGQLEGRKSWWDAVVRDTFVSEAVRGYKLELLAWPPVSLPVRPLLQETGRVHTCRQLELVYKKTNFQDGNVERRFSEHQENRLGGYNRPQGRSPSIRCLLRRVTVGSSGSDGKTEVFSSVASHSASVLLLGPSRQSPFQLWLCAGRRGLDW